MRFLDATVVLGLAAAIHGTDKAVRAAALRCAKAVPRKDRQLLFNVANSPSPLKRVRLMLGSLPDDLLSMDPATRAAGESEAPPLPLQQGIDIP
ncbi:hypothetical protein D3880_11600 [Pseudomonas cavernae]|uniref:DUF7740 domain-containing protein n=1 Tax=Pseudomonas cavernae TaxID=2320867 RepID=A0A385Z2H5_9PSED|nr:hypothetical protein D3880_11600 [Pseudomonas cavernae]